jgi:hypothetical protein
MQLMSRIKTNAELIKYSVPGYGDYENDFHRI